MRVFIVITTYDVELNDVRVFRELKDAEARFYAEVEEQRLLVEESVNREIQGTLRIAGDDAYCVQLIEKIVT